jgi:hypothetical protein
MRNLCKITYAERDESLERKKIMNEHVKKKKRIRSMTMSGNNVEKMITSSSRSIVLER